MAVECSIACVCVVPIPVLLLVAFGSVSGFVWLWTCDVRGSCCVFPCVRVANGQSMCTFYSVV